MTISASVVADSVSSEGIRLTTFELRYPKFIHGEFMTHRMFSRNASSSRAIPVERLIRDIEADPAMPVHWGRNQKGMQAAEEMSDAERIDARNIWLSACNNAVQHAKMLSARGAHKQLVNRLIEPYCHIKVVVTATNYDNFYALRRHKDAQPEIKVLADMMWDVQRLSTPREIKQGQWHVPYVLPEEFEDLEALRDGHWPSWRPLVKLSVARCARVSYLTHDGARPDQEADLALYERLVGADPLHASPAEHQATPDTLRAMRHGPPDAESIYDYQWLYPEKHGNFFGWIQFRKTLQGECVKAQSYKGVAAAA